MTTSAQQNGGRLTDPSEAALGRGAVRSGPRRHSGPEPHALASQRRGLAGIYKSPVAAAVAAALGLNPLTFVHAADTPVQLEEIVVTASRRSENIQDTPINITAVDSNAIGDLRLNNVDDVTRWVPGVVSVNQGPWNNNRIIMRGINAANTSDVYGSGNGGTVATYLGETPLFVDVRLLDIDRVEVLNGPQGTLYGAGTLAGAIRYIPNKPNLHEFQGTADVQAYSLAHASDPGYQGNVALNFPLIDGKLALRGVVGYYHDPGFIDDTLLVRAPGVSNPQPNLNDPSAVAANLYSKKDVNYDHTLSTRWSLLYQPFDNLSALLSYTHQDTRSDGRQVTINPILGTGRYESGVRFQEPVHRTANVTSLELTAELGFAELVSATSYATTTFDFTRDQTDQLLEFRYGYEQFPQFVAYAMGNAPNSGEPHNQFTQEVRLVSSSSGPFKWLIGGYYDHANFGPTLYREFTPGLPQFFGVNRPDNLEYEAITAPTVSERAIFGELGYHFTGAWQVTVGGRYFKYQADQTSATATPLFDSFFSGDPTAIPLLSKTVGVGQHSSIGKFNTSYQFTPDVMAYFTLSQGYRRGGVNTVPPCPPPPIPKNLVCALPNEQSFLPDKTLNHELGLRSTWFDKRLVLNGDVFYVKWQNVQVGTVTTIGGQQITGNGATASSKGVELQFQALLQQHWNLMGNYSYSNAKLTENVPNLVIDFNSFAGAPNKLHEAFDGDRLPGSPQQTASLRLQYVRLVANGYAFNADYGITYTGNVYTTVGLRGAGEVLGGYVLNQASIGVSKNNWRVRLYADNLFDKYAYTSTVADASTVGVINGFVDRRYEHSVIRPRQIGLELSTSF